MNMEVFSNPVLIWFLVGLGMFLLELTSPGMIIFFFGVGAWIVALATAVFKLSLNAQLFLFIVSSILSLVIFRRWLKALFHGHVSDSQDPADNLEEFVGHRAVVKEEITPDKAGKVEFKGTLWDAESKETLSPDAHVKIIRKDNITLTVES
ncbi:MAG: NfeD family protein [Candidatus Omnitrophica bacterium]|nr:NfeD family protein [Candidatus Omnitrophota bacterium]